MMLKALARFTMLLAIIPVPLTASGQATSPSHVDRSTPSRSAPSSATSQGEGGLSAKTDCNDGPCEDQQPRVLVTLPAPAPVPWRLHDRIAWAANLAVVIAGFIGIIIALSTLKKIERNGYDVLSTRIRVKRSSQAMIAVRQWLWPQQ